MSSMAKIGSYLVDMFPDNGTVMTHCFAETIVGTMLRECRNRGKNIRLFCPETRPYFQGARLTASVCHDMGFDVTVISDNMPAFVMQNEKVDVFTTAADAICCDGHVVNKVGTFQNAIVAKYMGIPYFVTGAPDQGHDTVDSIHIEMRDPNFTLQAMGVRTAMEGVKGYYPAFDITPPHLVSGVVTDLGIYSPYDLHRYFDGRQHRQGQSGDLKWNKIWTSLRQEIVDKSLEAFRRGPVFRHERQHELPRRALMKCSSRRRPCAMTHCARRTSCA